MLQPALRPSLYAFEPTFEELLANVIRNTGWIMAGGSAQFRSGALRELQANLAQLHGHTVSQRVAQAAKVLGEKAILIAANAGNDVESIMGLHRVLTEFEQAVKACLAASRKY